MNNKHLSRDDQKAVITARKKVVAELKGGPKKTKKRFTQKWKDQSKLFREAMHTNLLISKAQKEGRPIDYYL